MITLPDHDAIELAELLDWLAEFFNHTTTDTTLTLAFTAWADNPTAIADLTRDLHRWTNQLRTSTPT